MKLTPLADRVVLKAMEAEETTKGGIILTSSAKEKPSVAEVVSVGPGGTVDGKEVVMSVKPGDKVKRGQTIAKSGASGNVTSPQLHFEIRKSGAPVDPMSQLASN